MEERLESRFPIPEATGDEPWVTQLIERKSRFLAQTCQCSTRLESREFWLRIQSRHPDAAHNCWAFVAGAPGDTANIGYSDDGEPKGTAGKPMLNALLHCGIGQICVVVSRWFGGIKLGTGGLARAYQDAVLLNLESLPVVKSVPKSRWLIRANYAMLPVIQRILPKFEAEIEQTVYEADAELTVSVPVDRLDAFEPALISATSGQVKLQTAG